MLKALPSSPVRDSPVCIEVITTLRVYKPASASVRIVHAWSVFSMRSILPGSIQFVEYPYPASIVDPEGETSVKYPLNS